MGAHRYILMMSAALVLLLPGTVYADVASSAYPLRIKVLTAESHRIDGGNAVPRDCDLQTYSAYCNGSKDTTSQNIMTVQDGAGNSYTISCTVDSMWSKCVRLPVGKTFEARRDSQGITVLYQTAKGKEMSQLYVIVGHGLAPAPAPLAAASSPAVAPVVRSSLAASSASNAPVPSSLPEKVQCKFNSTPNGAEITLDGKYVGSTPSEFPLPAGAHSVVISMSGYLQWQRELTVLSGSDITVSAILQKEQQ